MYNHTLLVCPSLTELWIEFLFSHIENEKFQKLVIPGFNFTEDKKFRRHKRLQLKQVSIQAS